MSQQPSTSLQPGYFDDVYAANEDPWGFATSEYERDKYADTLRHLSRPRYHNAFEVGCSIGVLTAQLAARCDRLLSIDVSQSALDVARKRCAALTNVHLERMQFPETYPANAFDLILVSEVGYYWNALDLDRAIATIAALHTPDGHLVLVHWTPFVPDYPLSGDAVHNAWLERSEWKLLSDAHRPMYRISVLQRNR